jgi:hypothetical protein
MKYVNQRARIALIKILRVARAQAYSEVAQKWSNIFNFPFFKHKLQQENLS